MIDRDRTTIKTQSSLLETVQPFINEESPSLQVSVESPKVMDSNMLVCAGIDKSSVISVQLFAPLSTEHHTAHGRNQANRTNSNCQQSKGASSVASYDSSSSSSSHSSRSRSCTDSSDRVIHRIPEKSSLETNTNSANSSISIDRSNTNSRRGRDKMEDFNEFAEDEDPRVPPPEDSADSDGAPVQPSGTDSDATVFQSTDPDCVERIQVTAANPAYPGEAASYEQPVRSSVTQSIRSSGKMGGEMGNMIERAILDFCSSRNADTMRCLYAGVTNDAADQLRDFGRYEDRSASAIPHQVTGEIVKDGVIIGDIDIFAPRVERHFILPLRDSLILQLIKDPQVFRAICCKTRCQIEVTRRLLNRQLCLGGRWHKYMILRITGPSVRAITSCDAMLQNSIPTYKARKEYKTPAHCCLYMREEMPDNADLYFAHQRTGGASQRYGALKIESPYRQTVKRPISGCPWKLGLLGTGKLAFSNKAAHLCMGYAYPSYGYQTTTRLEPEYYAVNAIERIGLLHVQNLRKRQEDLAMRKALTVSVYR